MGIHEGKEKLLAAADHHNTSSVWRPDNYRAELFVKPVHLCFVLKVDAGFHNFFDG